MKHCVQCKRENPSSANYCMYCGDVLVEEEQLSEEAKLLKKLKEQEEENRLLIAALGAQLEREKPQPVPVVETVAQPEVAPAKTEQKPEEVAEPQPEIVVDTVEPKIESPVMEQEQSDTPVTNHSEDNVQIPKMFSRPFSFDGRIRRMEYCLSFLLFYGYIVFLQIVVYMMIGYDSGVIPLYYVLCIPGLWFLWAQGAKRCHDRNNSGWYQVIPFYGFWMLFAEGDAEFNDYGYPPKK